MKRLLICASVLLCSCSTVRIKPHPAPSNKTEKATGSLMKTYEDRLGTIAGWLDVIQPIADGSDKAAVLTPLLGPPRAAAGKASPEATKEAKAAAKAAEKGDTAPAEAATTKAGQLVTQTDRLKVDLDKAVAADRAAYDAEVKRLNAAWQAKLDEARKGLWNLLAGALIFFGVIGVAAGFAVRALALSIPMFGPKASAAISTMGAVLLAGGVCLYSIGPYLYILAIALGAAALCGLVAAVLCYANHQHSISP
jgi:hypothetical protein